MSEPTFALGELVKLLFALGVTIGLFYALALFMKRLQVGTGKSGSLITVLAALPLGTKEKIWVVDVAGEKLVLGTAQGSVNCLHVLKGEAEALSSFPRKRESSDEAFSSFPRKRESSDVAQPSSFRRTPESSVVESTVAETTLDPGFRRGDASTSQDDMSSGRRDESALRPLADRGFAELLNKFRSWPKP